jgi:hypothetical protein
MDHSTQDQLFNDNGNYNNEEARGKGLVKNKTGQKQARERDKARGKKQETRDKV